jgi:hypothetical protein
MTWWRWMWWRWWWAGGRWRGTSASCPTPTKTYHILPHKNYSKIACWASNGSEKLPFQKYFPCNSEDNLFRQFPGWLL